MQEKLGKLSSIHLDIRDKYWMKYVYCITNNKTKTKYFGSSGRLYFRLWQHRNELRNGNHYVKSFQDDYNKYGESSFNISVVVENNRIEPLKIVERFLIKTERNIYNSKYGAQWL